ncbi:MAG TPA: hypothetical protein VHL11_23185 [Phototrophicaceae bacterium]|jgi:hypothetical protein|nr:hypothetical protein [Phototrophicaceae bacterium]
MFDHYQNTTYTTLRQQQAQNQADMERLAAEAIEASEGEVKPFYAPVLNTIGHKLVELGSTLQERYGDVCNEDAPTITTQPQFASARK